MRPPLRSVRVRLTLRSVWGAQIVKPTPEELACGTLTDALVCRIAAKEVA